MIWLRQMSTLLFKDLRIEWRSKDVMIAMLMFAFIVITVFAIVFDGTEKTLIPGILWAALLFAGNLGMNRSMEREIENSALTGLRVCPVSRSAIYVGKLLSQLIFMLLTAAIVLPLLIVFFNMQMPIQPLRFGLILLLGCIGYSAAGTFLAAMALQTRARDLMLPILLFPLTVPVILAAVRGTTLTLYSEASSGFLSAWLRLLLVFDIIMITACILLFEYVIDE
ncbi:MAG: heme exporter protein CcmB [candidate division KSB1 bacterium]|nr:heme exporter protein CcmB [candidate division KSB1 bacterium]